MNNPNPTQAQLDREDAASQAEDTLALYESAKDSLVALYKTLTRCDRTPFLKGLSESIYNIEHCLFCSINAETSEEDIFTAQIVLEALEDGDPEGAKEAIDDHFAGYLKQCVRLRTGKRHER